MSLKFEDIDEWTPSSISIVDVPAHPLCKFEVYDNDEEFDKKSIEINEGELMEEQNSHIEEPMVQAPVSFFERLMGRTVAKAEEVPEPPKEEEKDDNAELISRIEKLEEKVAALEKEPEKVEKEDEATPGAVTKSEGEASEGETSEAEAAETNEEIVDEEEVVVKSKSIDPDTITISSTDLTLAERAGRNVNGMTW